MNPLIDWEEAIQNKIGGTDLPIEINTNELLLGTIQPKLFHKGFSEIKLPIWYKLTNFCQFNIIEGVFYYCVNCPSEEFETNMSKATNIIKKLKKTYGETVITMASEIADRKFIPTGFTPFDNLIGGFPEGALTVIYGPEKSGKSTFCYKTIAYQQRVLDKVCAVADVENSFQPDWAKKQGVNLDELIVIKIGGKDEVLEKKMDQTLKALEEGVEYLLFDSIHGMSVKKETSNSTGLRSMEEHDVAVLAQKLNKFCRRATPIIASTNSILVFIGQERESPDKYVQHYLAGGKGQKHTARLMLYMRAKKGKANAIVKSINDKATIIGWPVEFQIEKATYKGYAEGEKFELPFIRNIGFDELRSNVEVALFDGTITEVAKARWIWTDCSNEEKKFHGKTAILNYFEDNPNEYAALLKLMETVDGEDDMSGKE